MNECPFLSNVSKFWTDFHQSWHEHVQPVATTSLKLVIRISDDRSKATLQNSEVVVRETSGNVRPWNLQCVKIF